MEEGAHGAAAAERALFGHTGFVAPVPPSCCPGRQGADGLGGGPWSRSCTAVPTTPVAQYPGAQGAGVPNKASAEEELRGCCCAEGQEQGADSADDASGPAAEDGRGNGRRRVKGQAGDCHPTRR